MSGVRMASFAVPATIGSIPETLKASRCRSVPVWPLGPSASMLGGVMDEEDDGGIACYPCGGKGWLLCDFCNGQKINVKSATNRVYRRCPSCKAVGCILCAKCKVFKCVTFPNYDDGEDTNL